MGCHNANINLECKIISISIEGSETSTAEGEVSRPKTQSRGTRELPNMFRNSSNGYDTKITHFGCGSGYL